MCLFFTATFHFRGHACDWCFSAMCQKMTGVSIASSILMRVFIIVCFERSVKYQQMKNYNCILS